MHDVIAISYSIGHPDVFKTMTCDPSWPEIQSALLPKQIDEYRPDLCETVFRIKLVLFLDYLRDGSPSDVLSLIFR